MRKNILLIAGIIFLMFLLWGCPESPGILDSPPEEIAIQLVETKLTASDGAASDFFGSNVSLSSDGGTMLIGAYGDDTVKGVDSASVYIYKWNGSIWGETNLTASDGSAYASFGMYVSISSDGSSVLVGAPYDNTANGIGSGSAYIYKWNGSIWAETKLTASDGTADDYYGSSVSISSDGTTVLVGAYYDDDNGTDSGSAYIYKWNGSIWVETKLTASDGAAGDYYGCSVSISSDGNTVLMGAYLGDGNVVDSGSAYVYKWNGSTWAETKLTATDGELNDWFGFPVSISSDGDTVLAGVRYDDDNGTDSGSVYIYKWNGSVWTETKLTASDGTADDRFGSSASVSSDGTSILVGAYNDDDNGTDSGSAYIYKWDGSIWAETKQTASDGATGDRYGSSLSISSDGTSILVGAYYDDDNGTNSGSVYIYK